MPIRDAPQTTKQHAVPQNVMDVEFKLIGDLTLRQFAYLMVCGILAYVSYSTVVGIFKLPLVLFFVILGIGLAFVPIQERGMDEWFMNFVAAMYSPTQRVWRKEPVIPQAFLYDQIDVVKQELIALAPTSSRRKLEKFLEYGVSEEEIDPLDIPEREYIMKVKQAFAVPEISARHVPAPPPVPVSVAVEESPIVEDTSPVQEFPRAGESEEQGPFVSGTPEQEDKTAEASFSKGTEPEIKQPVEVEQREEISVNIPVEEKKAETQTKIDQLPKPLPEKIAVPQPPKIPVVQSQTSQENYMSVTLMTPDRHSGRRFNRLLPSEGDIILPIRGEKVLRTAAEQEIEEDISEKARKLQTLLHQLRRGGLGKIPEAPKESAIFSPPAGMLKKYVEEAPPETVFPETMPKEEVPKKLDEEAKAAVARLKAENERLNREIEGLREDIKDSKQKSIETGEQENLLRELEAKKGRTETDYKSLYKQIAELQNKLKQRREVSSGDSSAPSVKDYKTASRLLTTNPNVISGIVKDPEGNMMDDLLLMVKDQRGDPVRAFKTNGLGEFILTTPLDNGMYTIEVSAVNDLAFSFDIISVEAKGEVIPPIEIVGT